MATAKKEKNQDDELMDVTVNGGQALKDEENRLRRINNSSGFFVFNEDDMKSMTEFSPKGKSGVVNIREIRFNIENEELEK